MESIITLVLPYIAPSALPLIIVMLGIAYIQSKRKATAVERDKDSQELHDRILKHDFEITNIKGELGLQKNLNADLSNQINILSQSVAKFSVAVDMLSESVKEIREDLRNDK